MCITSVRPSSRTQVDYTPPEEIFEEGRGMGYVIRDDICYRFAQQDVIDAALFTSSAGECSCGSSSAAPQNTAREPGT
jgi:hypothetical protein